MGRGYQGREHQSRMNRFWRSSAISVLANPVRHMSAPGHSRRFRDVRDASGLLPIADVMVQRCESTRWARRTFWPLPTSWKASVDFVLEPPAGCAEVLFSAAASETTAGEHSGNPRLFEGAIAPGFRASTRYVVFK